MKRDTVVTTGTVETEETVIGADAAAVVKAIRDARQHAGLTQEQAAALRGHATSTISRWESGGLPHTWEDLSRYAHALGEPIVLRFGPQTKEAPTPEWATRLANKTAEKIIGALTIPSDALADALADRLIAMLAPPDEESPAGTGGSSQDA